MFPVAHQQSELTTTFNLGAPTTPFTQTHNRDTTGRITSSLTAQHETALFTEQFRYDARGRTTAHMQSFGARTGAAEHSRVWGLRYDARGHVALMVEARGVDPDQWTTQFESQVPLLNDAMAVAQRVQDGASQSQRSQHMFDVSALGTLLEEQVATLPSGGWPSETSWDATRAEGAIMPSAVNGAAVAWDALGRMESHDGLTIDDWSFDHRAL